MSGESTGDSFVSVLTSVYVIQAGEFIKVGLAENIIARLQVLRTHCPMDVRVAYCSKPLPRNEARKIEHACHLFLIEKHVRGEWFLADASIAINFINKEVIAERLEISRPVQLRLVG